jgi:hypothetical protein
MFSFLYDIYSQISFRIRALFHINRHSTGTEATRKFLTQGYKVGMRALDPINKGHLRIPKDSGLHSLKRPMRAMNIVKQFCLDILGLSQ